MTPEERFERIERDLANTAAINAETAQILKETAQAVKDMTQNLDAFIAESREGRKTLEANLNAFLRAMMGRTNGKA